MKGAGGLVSFAIAHARIEEWFEKQLGPHYHASQNLSAAPSPPVKVPALSETALNSTCAAADSKSLVQEITTESAVNSCHCCVNMSADRKQNFEDKIAILYDGLGFSEATVPKDIPIYSRCAEEAWEEIDSARKSTGVEGVSFVTPPNLSSSLRCAAADLSKVSTRRILGEVLHRLVPRCFSLRT